MPPGRTPLPVERLRAARRRSWFTTGRLKLALFVAAVLGWAIVLQGFVSLRVEIACTLLGPALGTAGLSLVARSLRQRLRAAGHAAALAFGLLLLAGAGLTLAPAAPAGLLVTSASGLNLLDARIGRFDRALRDGDARLARRLARRGLGDASPVDRSGRPLLHDVKDAALLRDLLESGLDPDAADLDGWTMLMNTSDIDLARALLAAGANANARRRGGETVLMASAQKAPALVALLVAAGAEIDAVDAAGRSVVDYVGVNDDVRAVLEARAGGSLPEARSRDWAMGGRADWLVVDRDPKAQLGPSTLKLDRHPLSPGDSASLFIRLANPSPQPRLLDVEADLNGAVLFVGASHDGAILNPARPGLNQTVRWPLLTLPEHSQGRLELHMVVRSEPRPGDLGVDVRVSDLPDPRPEVLTVSERLGDREPRDGTTGIAWPLGLLLLGGTTLWLLRRLSRSGAAGRAAAAGAALVCATAATLFAWTMVEPLMRFDEAACTILDRRVYLTSTRSSSGTSRNPGTASRSRTLAVPIVAVRIESDATPRIATGFNTDFNRSPSDLRGLVLGATVPCWVDPQRPGRFTLFRRPATGTVLAVTVLAGLALILGMLAKLLGGSGARD
jgi:hypothetical protein